MDWLRLWHDARTDRKLDALSDAQYRVFVNLLIFASEQPDRGLIRGKSRTLLAIEAARGDGELLEATLGQLDALEIVCDDEEGVRFLHWDERQPISDDTAARQRASRAARNGHENVTLPRRDIAEPVTPADRDVSASVTPVSRDRHVTAPHNVVLDTDTDTDTELETEAESEQPASVQDMHGDGERRRARASPVYSIDFEAWWTTYPRHDAKNKAAIAYARRRAAGRSTDALLAAARHYAQYAEVSGTPTEKIAHGATWLNEARDQEWERGPPDAERSTPRRAADRRAGFGDAGFPDYRSAAEKAAEPVRAWRQTYRGTTTEESG